MTDQKRVSWKFPDYWMCHACAIKMGGKSIEGVCTVMKGTCKYCDEPGKTLIPWVDFDWPKDKRLTALARMVRD